jgi:hypothetical protein
MAFPLGLSTRITAHPRLAHLAEPPAAAHPKHFWVAIKDQLLVGAEAMAVPAVHAYLTNSGWEPQTTLGSKISGLENKDEVTLFHHPAAFPPAAGPPAVFQASRHLRALLQTQNVEAGHVSPNHVLVPPGVDHSCPWGAPSPIPGTAPSLGTQIGPPQPITVIDSGYQWSQDWGPNPLTGAPSLDGEWIAGHSEADWLGPNGWEAGTADMPGEVVTDAAGVPVLRKGYSQLVALAGHANFVAGVLAKTCPNACITIVNHNGSFNPQAQDPPTEMSVATALAESVDPVVNVGFAFVPLDGVVSTIWRSAFTALAARAAGQERGLPIAVAPAGNQASRLPYFPAALGATDPKAFANMIGVAAHGAPFTNRGWWIRASAVGEQVQSTFLHVNSALEDDTRVARRNFANGWASWNGTCFAAPKVSGWIANKLAMNPGMTPMNAWAAFQAKFPLDAITDPNGDFGHILT